LLKNLFIFPILPIKFFNLNNLISITGNKVTVTDYLTFVKFVTPLESEMYLNLFNFSKINKKGLSGRIDLLLGGKKFYASTTSLF